MKIACRLENADNSKEVQTVERLLIIMQAIEIMFITAFKETTKSNLSGMIVPMPSVG